MIRFPVQIKKILLRIFSSGLWLIPAFVILYWNPFFPLLIKAEEASILSKNQEQKRPALIDSQIELHDFSDRQPFLKFFEIKEDKNERLLWKYQRKHAFLPKFETEVEIFQKKSSRFESPIFSSNLVSDEPDKQLEILRIKQKSNSFIYGLEYRYVGKDLKNLKNYNKKTNTKKNIDLKNDQEGFEIWGGKKIGSVGLKTFFSKFWNNVDRDPRQTRLLTNEYGLEMKYKFDFLPIYFSLSHSKLKSESGFEVSGSQYQGVQKDTYGGSLYYCGSKAFNMTASSNYSASNDLDNRNRITHIYWHQLSAFIRPAVNLYITPTVSFGEYRYLWYGEQSENPAISLSITLSRFLNIIDLTLWGEFSQTRSTDGYQDSESLNTYIGISWNEKYLILPKARFSLNFEYNQYDDKIYQSSSYDSFSASFQLKFQL